MKLRAEPKKDLGKTKHTLGRIIAGEPVEMENMPATKWLEIVEEKSGIFLYHFSADGLCVADTWHLSIQEAMAQAKFELQIETTDWQEIES